MPLTFRAPIVATLAALAALSCGRRPIGMSAEDAATGADAGSVSSPATDASAVDTGGATDVAPDTAGPAPDTAGPAPDARGPCTVTAADGTTVACTEMLVGTHLDDTYCGLKAGGQLRCWSYDAYFDNQLAPIVAKAPPGLVRIAVSDTFLSDPFLCGIDAQGNGTCWGANTWTELGGGVVSAVLSRYGTCALFQDGRVKCAHDFSELPPDRRYLQIAVSADFAIGLDDTGTPIHSQSSPPPSGVFRRIAEFSSSGAALRDDGALVYLHWQGQVVMPGAFVELAFAYRENLCGIDTAGEIACFALFAGRPQPPTPPPGPFVQIAASSRSMCGLRPTGTTTCWGETAVRLPDGW